MLLVVVVAVPCGSLRSTLVQRAKERQAVAEVQKLGGTPIYAWMWHAPGSSEPDPPGTAWVRKLFGEDFFTDISEVTSFFATSEMGDECLAHLDPFTELTNVCLQRSQVTDSGLGHLARIPNLAELSLAETNITDKGLEHLSQLPHLAQLKQLRCLHLESTAVTDAGLIHIRKLKGLVQLNVAKTGVTAAGVADLQKALPNCNIVR